MRPFSTKGAEQAVWLVIAFIVAILGLLIYFFVFSDTVTIIHSQTSCEGNGGTCQAVCGPGEQQLDFSCKGQEAGQDKCCFDPNKLVYGNQTNKEKLQAAITNLENKIAENAAANAGISAVDLKNKIKTGEVDLYNLNEYTPCHNKCDYSGYKNDLKQLDDLKAQLGTIKDQEKQAGSTGFCYDQFSYSTKTTLPDGQPLTGVEDVELGDVCWYGKSVPPHEGNDCGLDNKEPCYCTKQYVCKAGACAHDVYYYGFDQDGQCSDVNPTIVSQITNPGPHPCTDNATGYEIDPLLDASQTCTPPGPKVTLVKDEINHGANGETLYTISGLSNIVCNEIRPQYKFDTKLFTTAKITSSGSKAKSDYDKYVSNEQQSLVRASTCGAICSVNKDLFLKLYDLNSYLQDRDEYLTITQPFRTYEVQKCLFFQAEGDTSAACNPDNPPNGNLCAHQASSAIDVAINKGSFAGEKVSDSERESIMCDNGFIRYGPEPWHYEYGSGSTHWENNQYHIGITDNKCCYYSGTGNVDLGHDACTA